MALGIEVSRAMNRAEKDDPELLVYECVDCGRAFARERDSCPACNGAVKSVVLH
ncbi:MAG: hypothetical protein ACOCPX_07960 [Halapricum sp.]